MHEDERWEDEMTAQEKETSLKELEANLWETADSLRNESSLTSQMYYMPVLGIIFLRHATYRFQMVEKVLMAEVQGRAASGCAGGLRDEERDVRAREGAV